MRKILLSFIFIAAFSCLHAQADIFAHPKQIVKESSVIVSLSGGSKTVPAVIAAVPDICNLADGVVLVLLKKSFTVEQIQDSLISFPSFKIQNVPLKQYILYDINFFSYSIQDDEFIFVRLNHSVLPSKIKHLPLIKNFFETPGKSEGRYFFKNNMRRNLEAEGDGGHIYITEFADEDSQNDPLFFITADSAYLLGFSEETYDIAGTYGAPAQKAFKVFTKTYNLF